MRDRIAVLKSHAATPSSWDTSYTFRWERRAFVVFFTDTSPNIADSLQIRQATSWKEGYQSENPKESRG